MSICGSNIHYLPYEFASSDEYGDSLRFCFFCLRSERFERDGNDQNPAGCVLARLAEAIKCRTLCAVIAPSMLNSSVCLSAYMDLPIHTSVKKGRLDSHDRPTTQLY